MLNVSLYIPELFYPTGGTVENDFTGLDALEQILARARRTELEAGSYFQKISDLLSFPTTSESDIPVAAVSRLLDAEERPEGYWMRADPVHLRADRDALVLFPLPSGSLSQHEALALAAEVREVIRDRGWEIEIPIPDRWYVHYVPGNNIRTTELQQVTGRDINSYLPRGEDAVAWHRLLTEIQMQLHSSEVNNLREARGELPVNSLWFWGSGELPAVFDRNWSAVYGDDVFLQGLCQLSSTPCFPAPEQFETVLSGSDDNDELLIVLSLGQFLENGELYKVLEKNWFAPLLRQLSGGSVRQLRVITEKTEFALQKNDLFKFWRRKKPLETYLSHSMEISG